MRTNRHGYRPSFPLCVPVVALLILTASTSTTVVQDATLDTLIVYTPAARVGAYSNEGMEATIGEMVGETNQAFANGGLSVRVQVVKLLEVDYDEAAEIMTDLRRITTQGDGFMDAVHGLRSEVRADFVHLIVSSRSNKWCGQGWIDADASRAFAVTDYRCGGRAFAHELGHNLGLRHDRYQVEREREQAEGSREELELTTDGRYGYVNQRAFGAGGECWHTIMAYWTQCEDNGFSREYFSSPLRFSNPRQYYRGEPLGVPVGVGGATVRGAADAASHIPSAASVAARWY